MWTTRGQVWNGCSLPFRVGGPTEKSEITVRHGNACHIDGRILSLTVFPVDRLLLQFSRVSSEIARWVDNPLCLYPGTGIFV